MIRTWAFDVEILPNFFSITFINLNDYLNKFKDCEIDNRPIPLIQKYTVKEIKDKLNTVETKEFYITDTNDNDLLNLVAFLNRCNLHKEIIKDKDGKEQEIIVRTDLFGFNSNSYDDLMVTAFLMYYNRFDNTRLLIKHLHSISKDIISLQQEDKSTYYTNQTIKLLRSYKLPYNSCDVMKVFALNKVSTSIDENGNKKYYGKSLKQTSINLQWYELLEFELPPICDKDKHLYKLNIYENLTNEQITKLISKWDRFIIDEYIPDMMYYNKNDVFIVCEIIRLNIEEIRLRYVVDKTYKLNVLSSSRSNIADKFIAKYYSEFSGLNYNDFKDSFTERTVLSFNKVIFDIIQFKTKYLQDFLKRIKTIKIYRTNKDSFQEDIELYGTKYTIATGGIHSKDIPNILKSTDEYTYIHFDIGSFYPSLICTYGIYPKHLNKDAFIKLVNWIKTTRLTAKHTIEPIIKGVLNKTIAEVFKIVINAIYGKFGSETSFLKDKMALLRTTINGQLLILMLIEELELNCIHVCSANTDGIVVKLYKNKEKDFENITNNWMKLTNMTADSERYDVYICRDINNYLIRELPNKKGIMKVSYLGATNPEMYRSNLSKGYNMPIVAKAVSNYFLENIPIMETIMKCTNILDFCKTQNIGRNYNLVYTYVDKGVIIEKVIQRNTRFYVSTDGGILKKVNPITNAQGRLTAGYKCTIINSLDDKSISLRNIDYKYYYNEAFKLINPIKLNISQKGKGKSLSKKYSGMYNPLFDEDDYE